MKAAEHSTAGNGQSLDLQILIDSVPALIHAARPDGSIEFFNKTGIDFVGLPLDKMLGWGWTSVIHPQDVEAFVRKWREAIAAGNRFEHEARVRRADGEYRWMVHCVVPRHDADGNVVRWFGSSIDIEDRKRAEEALRQSEAYLAEGQRLLHAGSWALDLASNQYVYVSEEDFRIWGLDPRDGSPSRERVLGLIHPEDRDRWKKNFENTLHAKSDSSDEYRIVLPDGTLRHIYTIRHPILNEAGDLVKLVGTTVDITERKRAEEALRQSEAYLKEAQSLSHTASWAWDPAGGEIVYWSEEMFRLFGFDPHEPIPKWETWSRRIHPEDRDRVIGNIQKAIRDKADILDTYRIVLPDGAVRHIEIIRHPVLNAVGDVVKLVGTSMDITERKHAEEAIHQSEKQLRDVFEGIPAMAAAIRLDGAVEFINRRWREYTGMSLEDALGCGWHAAVHPQDIDAYLEKRRTAIANGRQYEGEFRVRAANGEYRWFLARGVPLKDSQENIVRWYAILTDIEDRKQTIRFAGKSGRPGKGSNKGEVKNLVGHARRNFMVPIPRSTSWIQLNAHRSLPIASSAVSDDCTAPLKPSPSASSTTEQRHCHCGPRPHEACKKVTVRVSSLSLVRYPHQRVLGAQAVRPPPSAGRGLCFLPPYLPDMNPIEKAWAKLKELLRAAQARTREVLFQAIMHATLHLDFAGIGAPTSPLAVIYLVIERWPTINVGLHCRAQCLMLPETFAVDTCADPMIAQNKVSMASVVGRNRAGSVDPGPRECADETGTAQN